MTKIFLCFAIAYMCSIGADAYSISCGRKNSFWCRIISPIDLRTEPQDNLVIENAEHKDNVTHFQWIDRSILKTLPNEIFITFPNLRVLDMTAGINHLKPSDLSNAGNMEYLYLKNNAIPQLTEGVFVNMPNIISIHIDRNEISEVNNFAFKGLDKLEVLNLEFNYITTLSKDVFAGAPNLKTVLLMRNDIAYIEDGAFNLEFLELVDFENNRLASIADTLFQNAPALATIDLMDNHLTQVPRTIINSQSLSSVTLGGNEIESVDFAEFAHMPRLEFLSFESCGIKVPDVKAIPPEQESTLTEIQLTDNKLTNADILQHLLVFKQLSIVMLDDNDFTKIDGIENIKDSLPHIVDISLDSNKHIDCNWLRGIRSAVSHQNFTLYDTDNLEDGSHKDNKICGNN